MTSSVNSLKIYNSPARSALTLIASLLYACVRVSLCVCVCVCRCWVCHFGLWLSALCLLPLRLLLLTLVVPVCVCPLAIVSFLIYFSLEHLENSNPHSLRTWSRNSVDFFHLPNIYFVIKPGRDCITQAQPAVHFIRKTCALLLPTKRNCSWHICFNFVAYFRAHSGK